MPEKTQFMILVTEDIRDRMDALRIVMGTSRADIGRTVLEKYIHLMERGQAERLDRLKRVAAEHGYPHWQSLVWDLLNLSASENTMRRGQRVPSLEVLEDPRSQVWNLLSLQSAKRQASDTPAAPGPVDDAAPAATFSG